MLLLVIAGGTTRPALAQSSDVCDCVSQLEALMASTWVNYAGYADKSAAAGDSLALARHTSLLHDRARRTPGRECLPVLRAWIEFFRDGHLQVRSALAAGAPVPRLDGSAAGSEAPDDRLIGLWESTSRRTRLRIVVAPPPHGAHDRYAVIVTSPDTSLRTGDVYATFVSDPARGIYHAAWLQPGRAPQQWPATIVDDSLLLTGFSGWHRIAADAPADLPPRRDPLRPSYRPLDVGAAVLALPSMQVQYAAAVDSIVGSRAREIGGLDLLIIDVRGNQGGGDGTYMPILPLIHTDSIITVSGSVLSSPANIAYYERFLDPAGIDSPAWVVDMLAEMRAHPGAQVALPASKLVFETATARPRNVAVLTDAVGSSSTETFLLKAVQSSRVRLFGQPTAGIVDYLNPAHHALGCGVTLQAPTIRRSVALPADGVDNRGIPPQVVIPVNTPDPIGFILRHYQPGILDRQ